MRVDANKIRMAVDIERVQEGTQDKGQRKDGNISHNTGHRYTQNGFK